MIHKIFIMVFCSFFSLKNHVTAQYIIQDTLQYSLAKTTTIQKVSNYIGNVNGWAQIFEAPVEVTVSGFNFYGVSNSSSPVNVIAKIFLVNTDSMIIGNALATNTITLDTNHYGIDFSTWTGGSYQDIIPFKHTVLFTTPITVNQSFVILIENPSDSVTYLFTNNYNYPSLDGQNEYLVNMLWNGTWYRSNDPALGMLFNADLLYEPIVEYDADVYYDLDPECISDSNLTVNFTIVDTSGNPTFSAYGNRMYSSEKFAGTPKFQFHWFYGTNENEYAINPSHQFTSSTNYTMILQATMKGWCNDTTISDWNYNTLEVCNGTNSVQYKAPIVEIFPNPANTCLYITNVNNNTITLFNELGKPIKQINPAMATAVIDLSMLPSGIYFIRIACENKIITKKFNIVR